MSCHPRIAIERFIFGKVNVIGVKGQMYVFQRALVLSVCQFVRLFPYSPRGPLVDFQQTWWLDEPSHKDCPWGIYFWKSQHYWGQRSNVCFSDVIWLISARLCGWMNLQPRIALERFIFGKGKVIGVNGQMSVFRGFFGLISAKLCGWMRRHPRIALERFIFYRSMSLGSKVKCMFYRGHWSCPYVSSSVYSPTPPRAFGRFQPNLAVGWTITSELPLRDLLLERSTLLGSKVKCLFFGCPLAEFRQTWWVDEALPKNCLWGLFWGEGQDHRGQRSNVCFSEVLGSIRMKLDRCFMLIPW